MSHHTNIVRIRAVYRALRELKDEVVFVGGATISLYADREGFEIRPTDDVDVLVEILNYSQRAELDARLRSYGFLNDVSSGVVCRYTVKGIIVDIMPTDDRSIGFHNKWYPEGFKNAIDHMLDGDTNIKILSAPYFVATKLEAFKGRGKNDGRTSRDFEDIVYLLENRRGLWDEIRAADETLQVYLKEEFSKLLASQVLREWIDAHVERISPSATEFIIEDLQAYIL